jgi:hypothetical protein
VTRACHVDADCGMCGFCSPSADPSCGPTYGPAQYACHKPGDACVTDQQCGADGGTDIYTQPFCSYQMTAATWSCGTGFCGG